MNNVLFYASLMLIAGLGIPVMAALNGGLGTRLQSPALASSILLLVGFVIATLYLLSSAGVPTKIFGSGAPWYYYFGGFFVMFYIMTITWVAPKFGVSNAVSFVLLGQLIAMSAIDHFGLFGSQTYSIDTRRIAGLAVMALGVFLVLGKTRDLAG
jgi:transporter family-2 protein